jgi:hypothetical protein
MTVNSIHHRRAEVAMEKPARRSSYHQTPIMYSNYRTGLYQRSRLHYSEAGVMYIEADSPFHPDSVVYVVMTNYAPGIQGPEAYRAYVTKVDWCKRLDAIQNCHHVGVRIVDRSHEIYKAEETGVQCMCDLCWKKIPFEVLHRTAEHVYLCPGCHKHLSAFPEGKIKDSIMRFLMGTVL